MRYNRSRPRRNCRSSASSASSVSHILAAPDRPCGSACRPFCASSRRSLRFTARKKICVLGGNSRRATIIARGPCSSSLSLNVRTHRLNTSSKTTEPTRTYRAGFKPRNRPGHPTLLAIPATSTFIHNNVPRCQCRAANVAAELGTFGAFRVPTYDFIGRPLGNSPRCLADMRTHPSTQRHFPPGAIRIVCLSLITFPATILRAQ